jgi:SAM-dependent methyltransferase
VRKQYRDSSNFDARVNLHARYSTNPHGWPAWMFDRIDVGDAARVLEVGCGPGWLWRGNLPRVREDWRVVLSDMSPGMAGEARSHVDDARFTVLVGDAQSLAFDDENFDAIVANHMLYHVPDLDAALAEFVRVMRPGGRLYAATNGRAHLKELRDILGTHWRYVETFGLSNGPERIARFFDNVRVERYPDSLEVPEADPVVAYVRSMSSFWDLTAEREALLRDRIKAEIARDGAFHISKDAGVIMATRP